MYARIKAAGAWAEMDRKGAASQLLNSSVHDREELPGACVHPATQ